MLRNKRTLIWMLCFILLCGGCLNLKQPRNKVEYYSLEYEPPAAGDRQPLPLVITVDQFTVNQWEAVLSIGVVLMAENEIDVSQAVLFQKTYHTRKPCRQRHPRALAEAMSLAMSEVSETIIQDIYVLLKNKKK